MLAGDGTLGAGCNCLHLPYLDGASFSGYRAKPWPVPENAAMGVPANATVTSRGTKNLGGAVDFALAHGMDKATELVVTGGSAGGLSTFLHTDRIARRAWCENRIPLPSSQDGSYGGHRSQSHLRAR